MAKLVFTCDFDTGTLASQGWTATGTAPILQRTYARGQRRAARVTVAAQQSYYYGPLTGFTTIVVSRVYLYFVSLPAATPAALYSCRIGAVDAVVGFNQTSGKFSVGAHTLSKVDGVTSPVAGRWYCLDVRVNTVTNPWVIDWQIDGVNQGTVSPAVAGGNAAAGCVSIGPYTAATLDIVFEDVATSATSADYPLGPTRERVLVVRRAGGRLFLPATPASVR